MSLHWNEIYEQNGHWDRWQYDKATPELVSAVACGVLPAKAACLDLGCGAGEESLYLASRGRSVFGIDFAPKAIEIAKAEAQKRELTADFRVGSVLELPYENNFFDFAHDRGCLHHIADNQRSRYAQELRRVLKVGGKCLLRGCRQNFFAPNAPVFHTITEETLAAFFKNNGFSWTPLEQITLVTYSMEKGGGLPAHITLLTRVE